MDYEALSKAQGGRCAICGRKETIKNYLNGNSRRLAIDHDHKTDKIRGLLCGKCNRGLGLFRDNIDFLQKAVRYLKKAST